MSKRVAYLKKIIRVRKKLMSLNQSKINHFEASRRIQELEKYVKAYGDSYGEDYWKGFLNRRKADIIFLIPSNRAQEAYMTELHQLL